MVFVTSVDARILLPKKRQVKAGGEADAVSATRGKAAGSTTTHLATSGTREKSLMPSISN
jgi:hypothetical protein